MNNGLQRIVQYRAKYSQKISSVTSSNTGFLGRCVDGNKNEIGLNDGFVDIGIKEQVLATMGLDNFL